MHINYLENYQIVQHMKNILILAKNPTHLLSFLQTSDYNHLLWKYVGKMLSNKPIYLNTHGLGISWLHVRLEWVPKYYHIH
jgi:hypothetical protein